MKSTLSDWLQAALQENQWSISELSRRSGVSQSHISNIISGNRTPSATALAALAAAFGQPAELAFAKAGLLPSKRQVGDELEAEWQHIFSQAITEKERKELIMRAKFELEQLKKKR
ncbi:MAG: helix-turn-helix transcriptional regulator [Anaerolineales bacterium]|nr:helix-turn-helix transcriptional regulator [Anaerolineales bacterium]